MGVSWTVGAGSSFLAGAGVALRDIALGIEQKIRLGAGVRLDLD